MSAEVAARPTQIAYSSPLSSAAMNEIVPSGESSLKKNNGMITTRRPRPTSPVESPLAMSSQVTPTAKRQKPEMPAIKDALPFAYPSQANVTVPSKATLKALFEKALQEPQGDQKNLKAAGILSLEQVLLPAIAQHEEAALKRIQAKVQRDHPQHKSTVEAGRRLIRQSIRNALEAVQVSRQSRMKNQIVRRQEALEIARQERSEKLQERARQRQINLEKQREEAQQAREHRFRTLQRQYPRNKDLWKEIVVLTRSRTQLEKEERMWKNAKDQQEEYRQKVELKTSTEGDNDKEKAPAGDDVQDSVILHERTESTVKDMVLASKRIQQGLAQVLTILKDSEKTRQQLYKEYRRDHHFYGYQGVRNPKNLIRFLSQEE